MLIGYGQVNHRGDIDAEKQSIEPVDLMAAAARKAADSTVLEAVDSIRVVHMLSAHYRNPGQLLGERIKARTFTTGYSGVGGNMPQSLVNRACLDIQRGRAGVVLLAGAETWRTRTGLRAKGSKLEWTVQDESVPLPDMAGDDVPMAGAAELRINLDRPAYVYPIFEQALRIAYGESIENHRKRIGELWARFSAVAADNPHAWIRNPVTADEIWQPGPQNRMVSWPYTKLMNSNNMVDQGAALLLTSVERATRLRIPAERWVIHRLAPTPTTHRPSPTATDCIGRRPFGSPVPGRWNWLGWGSMTSNTSTCIRAFPPLSKSPQSNSAWTPTILPAR